MLIRFGCGRYPGCRVDHLFDPAYTAVCSPTLLRAKLPLRTPADLRYHDLIHDDTIPTPTSGRVGMSGFSCPG